MPKHFEFVFAAYAIWVTTFTVYLLFLRRKSARAGLALKRLLAGRGGPS